MLALALRQRGVPFEVCEQADELREIGAAVALSANGTRELRRLGLGATVEAVSVVPSAQVIPRWDIGEVIADHPDRPRRHRIELAFRRSLPTAFIGSPCCKHWSSSSPRSMAVNLGRRCRLAVEEREDLAELRFADGTTAAADLVVGADGVHSMIRPHVAGELRGQFSGTVGYRGLVAVEDMPSLPDPTPLQFWAGPGRHLLHYAIDGGRTVNFLAVVRVPRWAHTAWMEPVPDVGDAVDAFHGWHPA